MCSCEPLSAEELVAAVCQDPEDDGTQVIDIDIHFVLDACSNLLVVDPQLGVCRFSHLSVQEYFEDHWDTNQTNGTVGKVCLSLLNDPGNWERGIHSDKASQDPEKTNQVDPLAKFLDYARRFWPTHIQNHGETNIDSRLSTLLKKFLWSINESGPAYKSWYKMYTRLDPSLQRNTLSGYDHDIVNPSYLASLGICLFGFSNVLAEWWEAGSIDPEQRNCQGHSLLVLAVLGSSSSVVKTLVKLGADVNAQLSAVMYGSALTAAGGKGNQNIVRLLLESGADVNAQLSGGRYGSALVAAAEGRGNQDIVRLLLESGADANAQLSGGDYGSALVAATARLWGDQNMVRLLLESGADANAQLSGGPYGSALAAAAGWGNEDIVRLLLESGADVNVQLSGRVYGSVLAVAAGIWGGRNMVRLLLESGADVNAQLSRERYGSALVAAVRRGNQDMVRLLLESGADVNAQLSGGRYASALAAATTRDNQDIVQVLLEYGIVQEKSSPNPPA
jgi:ankyrin repeat protein